MSRKNEDITNNIIRSPIKFDRPKAGENLASRLIAALEEHADLCLLVDGGSKREWTGAELLRRSARVAFDLIFTQNVKPGEVVMSMCDHNDEEVVSVLGAILSGAAICPVSPRDGPTEIGMICDLIQPKVIITNRRHENLVGTLWISFTCLEGIDIVYVEDTNEDYTDINNNNEECNAELEAKLLLGRLKEVASKKIKTKLHPATFMLTSGSTSHPKVVRSTHWQLLNGLSSMISATKYAPAPGKRPLWPISKESVFAGDLPMDHGAGFNTMILSFSVGAKFVVLPSYEVDAFWQGVHDYRITTSIASATFTYNLLCYLKNMIATGEASRRGWDLTSLKFLTCTGAKMAFDDLVREIRALQPQLSITSSYGCTEIGLISALPIESSLTAMDSVGLLCPGLKAKIVDPTTGKAITSPGARGELCIWSASKFSEYKCHPDENAAQIFADAHDEESGFYRTGDLVHIDTDGLIYIHGRIRDTLVLAEDWKIAPAELERVINEHPLVQESVVVGVPNTKLIGCDSPKAFVKLIKHPPLFEKLVASEKLISSLKKKDLDYISRHIYRFVAERTAEPKHLTGGVRIIDEFPRVGLLNKIDRKRLKVMD